MMNEENILQMKGINKSFGGVQVLHDVDFSMARRGSEGACGRKWRGKVYFNEDTGRDL